MTPYRADRNIGKIRVKQLRGASLYVEAERHVSAEWLELELRRHLDAMRGAATMADCPLDLEGVQVRVDSRGPGFVVTLVAKDSSTAQEVLRRARLLLARELETLQLGHSRSVAGARVRRRWSCIFGSLCHDDEFHAGRRSPNRPHPQSI